MRLTIVFLKKQFLIKKNLRIQDVRSLIGWHRTRDEHPIMFFYRYHVACRYLHLFNTVVVSLKLIINDANNNIV